MAELILGGIGAAIGSAIPGVGWLAGFQVGATLGSLLFPPEGPSMERGRVDEIRLQGASQGAAIPIIYGRNRTAGTIIWATGIIETASSSSSGGKGGGGGVTVTDYAYTTSLAVLICEGTLTKIRRIWANEIVIYDWRTGGSATLAPFLDPSKVRVYLGNQTTPDAAIEADKGAGNVPAHKGTAYIVFEDFPLANFGNVVPNFSFEVESGHADLKAAMEDVAARIDLSAGEYDFTALSGMPTRGMVVGARTEGGRIWEAFALANLFEVIESQGKVKAVIRNGTPVFSIPADDIGATDTEDADASRHVETVRAEETELPREMVVAYQSEALDFQQWTQVARRTVRNSQNQEQVNFPMGLGDSHARYLSDALLMERWASRARHKLSVPYKWLKLDAGDVGTIPDESGGSRTVRVVDMSMGLLAQIEIQAVDDDPIIYVDPGLPPSIPTGGGGGVDIPTDAIVDVFETTAAYDAYADAPRVGIVAGRSSPGWGGGYVEADPPMGQFSLGYFIEIAQFSSSSHFGRTTNDANGVLGMVGGTGLPYGLDTVNTVRVTMTSGTLASCTYDEMVQGLRNLAVVGKEIIQFQTATLVSGSTYTVSNLLRFRRGTDHLLFEYLRGLWDHDQEDTFALFDDAMKSFAYSPGIIGDTHEYRVIEYGKDYSGGYPAFADPLTTGGDSRLPYGPCDLRYNGDRSGGAADVILSWTRRVRTGGEMQSYSDAPLDEAAEAYNIEIWNSSLTTKLNTYTASTPSYTYTIAQQAADGATGTFQFVVRQVSPEQGIGPGLPSVPKTVTTAQDIDY